MDERLTPPAALLLVHGAGSGPSIYTDWGDGFPGIEVAAVDLQEGLDVARASMRDYVENVVRAIDALPPSVALCGWSMGGLVVLQATQKVVPHSVVLIESSPPAEVQGYDATIVPREGTVDIEEIFGSFPKGMGARPESLLARLERHRGISVPTLPCPSLVVYGAAYPDIRGRAIARRYGSVQRSFPELGHWGLITDPRVRGAIAEFLGVDAAVRTTSSGATRPRSTTQR